LEGSSNWDTTSVQLSVEVEKPATPTVAAQITTASNSSSGTANGPELIWNGQVVNGVTAGNMVIGQGTSLSVVWAGPINATRSASNYSWNVPAGVGGYNDSGSVSTVLPIIPSLLAPNQIHFYWKPQGGNGNAVGVTASVSGDIEGNSFSLNTNFDIWTPSWSFVETGIIGKATDDGHGFIQLLDATTGYGVVYTGTVTDSGIPTNLNLSGGQWSITQLATPGVVLRQPGVGEYWMYQTGVEGLDTYNHASFDENDPINNHGTTLPVYAPVGPASHQYADSPGANLPKLTTVLLGLPAVGNAAFSLHESFRTFFMFTPPGGDSIDVPLAVVHWQWSFQARSSRLGGPQQPLGPVIWNIIAGTSQANADLAGKATSEFPVWTYVVHGDDFRKGF
jgi:hypothetical protein